MKRICAIAVMLIMALSCSVYKVDRVSVTGRLLKSNGSPIPGVVVYLFGGRGKGSSDNTNILWNYPSEDQRVQSKNKTDNTGRFTIEFADCSPEYISTIPEIKFTIAWGYGLHMVSNNGEPVVFNIDCKSKEINLADLVSLNLNAVEANKFIVIGIVHKSDGSPIAGAKLIVNEVTRQGDKISYSSTYDRTGLLLNPKGEADGNGEFAIYVDPSFAKQGQDYAINFEQTLSEVFGRKEVLTAVLGKGNSPLLFKIEGAPREINLGEFTVEKK